MPSPFEMLFRAVTSRPVELEKAVHDLLAPHRNKSNREFFRVSPEFAAELILKMHAEIDGIATWSAHSRILLRSDDRLLLSMRAGQIFALLAYPELFASSATMIDLWQSHADGDTLVIYPTDSPSHVAGLSDGDPGAEEDPVPFLNRTGTAANGTINGRERLVPGDRLLWMDASGEDGECPSVMFEVVDYCQIVSVRRRRQPGRISGLQAVLCRRCSTSAASIGGTVVCDRRNRCGPTFADCRTAGRSCSSAAVGQHRRQGNVCGYGRGTVGMGVSDCC